MYSVHYLKIFFDLLVLAILLAIFCVIKYLGKPFKSSFYCNDFSINMPYKDSTVSNLHLVIISFFPVLVILLTEIIKLVYARINLKSKSATTSVYKLKLFGRNVASIPSYIGDLYNEIGTYLFGLLVTADLTDFSKIVVGRLRPNFLDVCKPDVNPFKELCKSERTFLVPDVDFRCTSPEKKVNESRLSFPSGHTSLSFYAIIYLILFIKYSWSNKKLGLIPYLVQVSLLGLAFLTALTRVTDNKHHPTDLIAGATLGIVISLLCFFYLSDFLRKQLEVNSKYSSLARANYLNNTAHFVDSNNNSNVNKAVVEMNENENNNNERLSKRINSSNNINNQRVNQGGQDVSRLKKPNLVKDF